MKRDPRTDPWPGDVLRRPSVLGNEQREYLGGGMMRSYDLDEEHTPRLNVRNVSSISTIDWRKWAKNAEVIHASKD